MRTAAAIIVGLAIGLPLGMLTVKYLEGRGDVGLRKSEKKKQATAQPDRYFSCQPDGPGKPSALIIKGDSDGARKIIFPHKTDGDEFLIEQTTDLEYLATNVDPTPSTSNSSIELNRVTGDLSLTMKYRAEAVTLLASMCENRLPREQCIPSMERIGGGAMECLIFSIGSGGCEKWTKGYNFIGRYHYLCTATDRRF